MASRWANLLLVLGAFGICEVRCEDSKFYFENPETLPPAPKNLKHAFIMFEHGIRTPLYDIIPHTDLDEFSEGRRALTAIGKQLMLHVGKSLRSRYQSVASLYDESKVHVTSTPSGRTNMAAEVVALGMFPFPDPPLIAELPGWQPIPVWEVFYDKAHLFDQTKEDRNIQCPSYAQLRDEYMSGEKSRERWTRRWYYKNLNKRLVKYLNAIQPGTHSKNMVTNLEENFRVWDALKMKSLNRFGQPDWLKVYIKSMENLALLRVWSAIHSTTDMVEFFTGTMYNEILKSMEESAKGQRDGAFLHLHATRDVTMCALTWTLGILETYLPQPGDVLMLEVDADNMVKMYHFSPLRESQKDRFKVLTMNHVCGQNPCPLATLKERLKAFTHTEADFKKKCSTGINLVPRKEPKASLTLRTILGI